jgi:hypothetical protein
MMQQRDERSKSPFREGSQEFISEDMKSESRGLNDELNFKLQS